ncbi:hypothetical protein GRJ2_002447400 [Grus japonensis]|uniref:Uncharacterized protein n=1 Tax=Grus japonensis TaxID=30415 RepID=A0ABC9XQ39_GRUJA
MRSRGSRPSLRETFLRWRRSPRMPHADARPAGDATSSADTERSLSPGARVSLLVVSAGSLTSAAQEIFAKPQADGSSSVIQPFHIPRGSRLVLVLAVRGPSPGEGFAETLAGSHVGCGLSWR